MPAKFLFQIECPLVDECKNELCSVRQILKEKRSPWLFKGTMIERTEDELMRKGTIVPRLRVGGLFLPSYPQVECEDYQ